MTGHSPRRLSTDPDSPFYDADVLARGVGVRLRVREDMSRSIASRRLARSLSARSKDRHGNPLTLKVNGVVEPYFRDAGSTGSRSLSARRPPLTDCFARALLRRHSRKKIVPFASRAIARRLVLPVSNVAENTSTPIADGTAPAATSWNPSIVRFDDMRVPYSTALQVDSRSSWPPHQASSHRKPSSKQRPALLAQDAGDQLAALDGP